MNECRKGTGARLGLPSPLEVRACCAAPAARAMSAWTACATSPAVQPAAICQGLTASPGCAVKAASSGNDNFGVHSTPHHTLHNRTSPVVLQLFSCRVPCPVPPNRWLAALHLHFHFIQHSRLLFTCQVLERPGALYVHTFCNTPHARVWGGGCRLLSTLGLRIQGCWTGKCRRA